MFINLSNHSSASWAQSQITAANGLGGDVLDLPFPNVSPEASTEDVEALAQATIEAVPIHGVRAAMVQGEFTLVTAIVSRLQARGVPVYAATTVRIAEDIGEGKKVATFAFVQFRAYPPLGLRCSGVPGL